MAVEMLLTRKLLQDHMGSTLSSAVGQHWSTHSYLLALPSHPSGHRHYSEKKFESVTLALYSLIDYLNLQDDFS